MGLAASTLSTVVASILGTRVLSGTSVGFVVPSLSAVVTSLLGVPVLSGTSVGPVVPSLSVVTSLAGVRVFPGTSTECGVVSMLTPGRSLLGSGVAGRRSSDGAGVIMTVFPTLADFGFKVLFWKDFLLQMMSSRNFQ